MAISPPSDIIGDVARAADPARVQAAAQKLSEGASLVAGADFGDALKDAGFSAPSGGFDPYAFRTSLKSSSTLGGSAEPYRKFESFVLQTFIEAMLPKDAATIYGKGTAGSIWKSMMAEQLSTQITKAGGVGIANQLAAKALSARTDI
ncbi:rod-binding protein [Bosea sp. 2KB_26]|uniref:rod-binding protein n=1 Tax=Bosea sp. 2KB_26 TaxID=3237475 RepID=UPI003F8E8BED